MDAILAKFRNASGFHAAGCSGKWIDDCRAVSRLAAELRKQGLPIKIVQIDGHKYAEFLVAASVSDSSEMRRKFAEQKIANRGYTMSAAALAVRRKYAKTGGRPRKNKNKEQK